MSKTIATILVIAPVAIPYKMIQFSTVSVLRTVTRRSARMSDQGRVSDEVFEPTRYIQYVAA